MSDVKMDPKFATALRVALVDRVNATPATPRRRRARVGVGLFITVGIAGGGVAAASQFLTLPGGNDVRHLDTSVTTIRTGTATVDLGTPPDGANHLDVRLTCLTPGIFTLPDGARLQCDTADAGTGTLTYTPQLGTGEHSTTVTTDRGARWQLTATYSDVRTTEWATNDSGSTFGQENYRGTPDLVAVTATNGRQGYVYARKLAQPSPSSPAEALAWQAGPQVTAQVPVYESDGKTVIGEFTQERPAAAGAARDDTIKPAAPSAP